ncbi:Type II secretion system protein G precursor [Rubripirellula tenax]|uniref:Type II secretion system core protein G n=1 Tax=Rubripirellula tenax TaxID=2528015 RepID=A0A5C6FAE3_9BACT|nr:type II secretion system major pseudopilin GspG [Rubripirellula tenax]TWU58435.1 Type II secretion system protein G precursor [Rubripirellula tenax]
MFNRFHCTRTTDDVRIEKFLVHEPSHRSSRRRHAFSLVELIVVMVILGMLAGLVAVRTRGYLISSKQNAAKAEIANIVKAIETFYADQGRYPTTDEGLDILVQGTDSWPDGFLNKLPRDPWKNPYEYISPGTTEPYEVISLGADGREGGEAENSDFSSEALGSDA